VGRALDLQLGSEFDSRLPHCPVTTVGMFCTPVSVSVTKQCEMEPV